MTQPPAGALIVAFADSEVAQVMRVGTALHVRVSAAAAVYADPVRGAVTGHATGVTWVLGDAVAGHDLRDLLGRVATGRVELGGRWLAQVAAPSEHAGPVRLELTLANRSVLAATGSAFACRIDGEPRFTESLAC